MGTVSPESAADDDDCINRYVLWIFRCAFLSSKTSSSKAVCGLSRTINRLSVVFLSAHKKSSRIMDTNLTQHVSCSVFSSIQYKTLLPVARTQFRPDSRYLCNLVPKPLCPISLPALPVCGSTSFPNPPD